MAFQSGQNYYNKFCTNVNTTSVDWKLAMQKIITDIIVIMCCVKGEKKKWGPTSNVKADL